MPTQMPDNVLLALGFYKATPEGGDPLDEVWTHQRKPSRFYYHILTPRATMEALIEIGHQEFRKAALDAMSTISLE